MAASKNHPAAMYKLGVYSFYSRMGLPNNINTKKMGIKWLERASNIANELVAAAPYELGKIHFEGFEDIVIPDKKYALELYSQAAALGHVAAAALLGKFYEVGRLFLKIVTCQFIIIHKLHWEVTLNPCWPCVHGT